MGPNSLAELEYYSFSSASLGTTMLCLSVEGSIFSGMTLKEAIFSATDLPFID